MIETDQQRRWWFATHPEYSWSRTGQKSQHLGEQEPGHESLSDWWERRFGGHPAASRDSYDQYEDVLDRMDAYNRWAIELDKKGLEPDPHTFLDIAPVGKFFTAPIQALKSALRSLAENAVVSAVKRSRTAGGPGQWGEVKRGPYGLEHQSKMSSQPIRESGGHYHINEYKIGNTHFDDYRDGILYEYKGPQGFLFNKNNELLPWVKKPEQFRDEAWRQVKAANGIPVVWRVGRDQVEAFKKAVGRVPGIKIVP